MSTKSDLVHYLHRAAFSPVISTWTKAINAVYYTTWPGLTSQLVRKHLPKALATSQGHLRQQQRNVQSTKTTATPSIDNNTPEMTTPSFPIKEPRVRTKMSFLKSIKVTGKISTDQTGRFPVTSICGSKYLMILYNHDSNSIISEPLKLRSEHELIHAYSTLHTHLSNREIAPQVQMLNNECPDGLKQDMQNAGVAFQLVPSHLQRTNAAELAIATYKDHLIASLSRCDPSFQLHLWYRLVQQGTLTLNLLQHSRINPRLSSEYQLNGAFSFNLTPLAPPVTTVLVFEAPGVFRAWTPHGVTGWYIGSAPEHYRCYQVYIPKTRADRIVNTVEFFPHDFPVPKISSVDAAVSAAGALGNALSNPRPSPFSKISDAQIQAIQQLARIFDHASQQATAVPPSTRDARPASIPAEPPRVRVHTTPYMRVPVSAPPPRVPPSPTHSRMLIRRPPPNLIDPDHDDPTAHCYPLRLQHSLSTTAPRGHTGIKPRYVDALNHLISQEQANAVIDEVTDQSMDLCQLLQGPKKSIWHTSLAKNLGRLTQGVGTCMPCSTNTVFYVPKSRVPDDCKVTYAHMVATIHPHKIEVNRVCVTIDGDVLDYPGATTTDCSSLTTTKCLLNSTISIPDARFMTLDIKYFYYGAPMSRFEYMKLALDFFPDKIIKQYNLRSFFCPNVWIYMEIRKGMPGLKQSGRIANYRLKIHLAQFGYAPVPCTPALWKHATCDITFSLVVDDFGVKYVGKENADHLIQALKKQYTLSVDWTG